MKQEQLEKIFLEASGLLNDTEADSIAIGCLTPSYCPSGVDAVMQKWTEETDLLLQLLPEGSKQKIELLSLRGFTFSEYQELFNITIPESSFQELAVFRYFYLTKEKERKRFIYHLKDRYDDYFSLLAQSLVSNSNKFLFSFFFREGFYCSYISKKFRKSLLYRGQYGIRKEPDFKSDVLRTSKKITSQQKVCNDTH